MTTNYSYYRKEKSCYYRTKPKRWHRAVASRSSYRPPNPNSFSRFIPGEKNMDHYERKSFVLPCGKTLAQSWVALRKAWLGFKIARSNDDTGLMTSLRFIYYKVQMEMGMQTTTFDSTSSPDFCRTDCEIMDRFGEKFVENECTIEEDDPDYDSFMDDARSKVNHKAEEMTPPRQNIFDKFQKIMPVYRQEKEENKLQPKITTQTRHIEKSWLPQVSR